MNKKIKWGIVGLGGIARKFADDLQLVPDATLVAVASSNLQRAKDFAGGYGVDHFYDDYEAFLGNEEVDAVYIASYHTLHAAQSIKAMEHKKHVLCEKPVAVGIKDLQQMLAVARENQVFFMEALWSRFNPAIARVKELADAGKIGKLRYLHADFAFYALDRGDDSRLLNTDLGGGSLLDIGIYPIFLSYLLLGKPQEIIARSKFFKTGAEVQTSMIFDYKEAQAILYSGFTNNTEMKAKIGGEAGEIFIDPVWHETDGFSLVIDGVKETVSLPKSGLGYVHEILETQTCIRKGLIESPRWTHQNSIDLLTILDTVRAQVGVKFPFEE